MVGSYAVTLDGIPGAGTGGRIQTRAEAEAGLLSGGAGKAVEAAFQAQEPTPGPDPTSGVRFATARSDTPATGSGPWVESSAETGRIQASSSVAATVTG